MAGERKITFYEPVLVKSASGAETKTYRKITVPDWFVEPKWTGTGEKDEGNQRVATTKVTFKMRYYSVITKTMVIQMEGLYYDILKINPLDRRQWMMIEAEEKDNDWQLPLFTP